MNRTAVFLLLLYTDISFVSTIEMENKYTEMDKLRRAKWKYMEATKRPMPKEYHQEDIKEMYLSAQSGASGVALNETPDQCEKLRYCYPKGGEVLLGRESMVSSSSTCGLNGPERYCWPDSDDDCFLCDSRQYNYLYSHRIGKSMPLPMPRTMMRRTFEDFFRKPDFSWNEAMQASWWQSKNGEEKVTIQIDLESKFVFLFLSIHNKFARPSGVVVEMSDDFGLNWGRRVHFTNNCTQEFPRLPQINEFTLMHGNFHSFKKDEDICVKYLSDSNGHRVVYSDHSINPLTYYDPSPKYREASQVTNIRINFTSYPLINQNLSVPADPDSNMTNNTFLFERQNYALFKISLTSRCLCNGHADKCITPKRNNFTKVELGRMQVFSECVCRHNTAGNNCEFCKPGFFLPQGRSISDSRPCEQCDCNLNGSVNGTVCDRLTDAEKGMESGRCHCKRNVEGTTCYKCMEGYHNLRNDNPDGCERVVEE